MKFKPKPNRYYRRYFYTFNDDIIKMSDDAMHFNMLWEKNVYGKWIQFKHHEMYTIRFMSEPLEYDEYNTLQELIDDMFLELM